MNHKRKRPVLRRAGCTMCKFGKKMGSSALRGTKTLLNYTGGHGQMLRLAEKAKETE